jgi:hypothetical protein
LGHGSGRDGALPKPPKIKNRSADVYTDAMNDDFVIELGSPPLHPRAGVSKYPLDQLRAGECMTAKASAGALRQAVRRYRAQCSDAGRFTVREGVGGMSKVYRVE